jgi:hypothetical protein
MRTEIGLGSAHDVPLAGAPESWQAREQLATGIDGDKPAARAHRATPDE